METRKKYRFSAIYCLLPVLALLTGPAIAQSGHVCQSVDVVALEEPIEGTAKLCTTPWGVKAQSEVMGLTRGNAYTVWFVYFDDPSQCVHGGPGICGDADFFTEDPVSGELDPLAVLGRFDSVVPHRAGEIPFRGRVRGLNLSSGSQVWLLTFGHGPADTSDNRRLARQLLTPEDPMIGVPHLGNNVDGPLWSPVSVAVFSIP